MFSNLDLATRLIPCLLASSGTTLVRCTCRCISYRLYDDWVLNLTGNSFWTLAPRAYVTYYQAQRLSGHTSPCGECVCFSTPMPLMFKDATLQDHLHFFSEIQVGTLPRTEIFFFFLKSTIHSSDNLLLQRQRWLEMSRTQASLFREG